MGWLEEGELDRHAEVDDPVAQHVDGAPGVELGCQARLRSRAAPRLGRCRSGRAESSHSFTCVAPMNANSSAVSSPSVASKFEGTDLR